MVSPDIDQHILHRCDYACTCMRCKHLVVHEVVVLSSCLYMSHVCLFLFSVEDVIDNGGLDKDAIILFVHVSLCLYLVQEAVGC